MTTPSTPKKNFIGWLYNLRLMFKLGILVTMMIAPMVAATFYSMAQVEKVDAVLDRVVDLRMPTVNNISRIAIEAHATASALRGYMLTGNRNFAEDRQAAASRLAQTMKEYGEYARTFTVEENRQSWNRLEAAITALLDAQKKIEDAQAPNHQAIQLLIDQFQAQVVPLHQQVVVLINGDGKNDQGLVKRQVQLLIDETKSAKNTIDHMELVTEISMVASAMVALGALVLLFSLVIRPLGSMTGAMRKIAANDYNAHIPASEQTDEVGQMAKALVVFRDGLKANAEMEAIVAAQKENESLRQSNIADAIAGFEMSTKAIVDTVSAAATQLEASASNLATTSEESMMEAASVASASQQASSNVSDVAAASEELSASADEIARLLESSAVSASAAVARVKAADASLNELADAGTKIGTIVSFINTLAAQTNLLALNATIEAARAGDAGRGFAIVAAEVKALALQTSKATSDIGQSVQQIQSASSQTISAVNLIAEAIAEIDGNAQNIRSAVSEQGRATTEISSNVQQAARGTDTVSNAIVHVSNAAAATSQSATEIMSSSGELARQASGMQDEVRQFLDRVRAA